MDARLFHVQAAKGDAERLLRNEDGLDVQAISSRGEVPTWLPEELHRTVLTPEQAKGLEWRFVCVLDAGKLLADLDGTSDSPEQLVQLTARTAIDNLRVALSRSTEMLALVDVEPDEAALGKSRRLLAGLNAEEPASVSDFLEHLRNADVSREERVETFLRTSRHQLEENPAGAWNAARQAFRALGSADEPNGVAITHIRRETCRHLLATAVRLLLDGLPIHVPRKELTAQIQQVVDSPDTSPDDRSAWVAFEKWSDDRDSQPFDLLISATRLSSSPNDDWLSPALADVAVELATGLNRFADDPACAAHLAKADEEVAKWLRLTGSTGTTEERRRLRLRAFNALAGSRASDAARVAEVLVPDLADALSEAERTAEEAEQRTSAAEQRVLSLEAQRDAAGFRERKAVNSQEEADLRARLAEERASKFEISSQAAAAQVKKAEEARTRAELKARGIEERATRLESQRRKHAAQTRQATKALEQTESRARRAEERAEELEGLYQTVTAEVARERAARQQAEQRALRAEKLAETLEARTASSSSSRSESKSPFWRRTKPTGAVPRASGPRAEAERLLGGPFQPDPHGNGWIRVERIAGAEVSIRVHRPRAEKDEYAVEVFPPGTGLSSLGGRRHDPPLERQPHCRDEDEVFAWLQKNWRRIRTSAEQRIRRTSR